MGSKKRKDPQLTGHKKDNLLPVKQLNFTAKLDF